MVALRFPAPPGKGEDLGGSRGPKSVILRHFHGNSEASTEFLPGFPRSSAPPPTTLGTSLVASQRLEWEEIVGVTLEVCQKHNSRIFRTETTRVAAVILRISVASAMLIS